MSIDIDWNRFDSADHESINESVRSFLDAQFQKLRLPSYIASVSVIAFDIGTVGPVIEIKHIGDPYQEFYEDSDEHLQDGSQQQGVNQQQALSPPALHIESHHQIVRQVQSPQNEDQQDHGDGSAESSSESTALVNNRESSFSSSPNYGSQYIHPTPSHRNRTHAFASVHSAPNLQYFHAALPRPLIPTLNSQLQNPLRDLSGLVSPNMRSPPYVENEDDDDDSALAAAYSPVYDNINPAGTVYDETTGLRVSSSNQNLSSHVNSSPASGSSPDGINLSRIASPALSQPPPFAAREEDIQLLMHIKYKGDVKIILTATLRINYPSPNFLTLPIKLIVTGLEVDAMSVLAYISRQIHFSFISDVGSGNNSEPTHEHFEVLKNIKVESEIGDQVGKGAVLKNVGKVEKFVLERLRALVRDEIAWPNWITFEF
ncbi:ERMES complex subunit MDM12 [Dipodascopsis uninucleata]